MVYKIDNNKVKILTKDGECTLHITLDVNINFTGGVGNFINQNSPQNTIINSASNKNEEKEEKTMWEIPDFKSTKASNINFGK
jgi:hypothetical protein